MSPATTPAAEPQPDQIIPLDVAGPRPTAQLHVGDHPAVTVIFDSGAGGTVISTAAAKTFGLVARGPVQVGSPGGTKPIQGFFATIPSARLGNVEIHDVSVVVADLPLPLPGIAGALSPNIFAGSLVRFEWAESRVVVVDKNESTTPTGEACPYSSGMHPLPALVVDVAGVKMDAHLDSGSGRGLSLPLDAAQKLPLRAALAPADSVRMVGRTFAAFTADIDGQVHVGPLTLTNPRATFVDGAPIANIGASILKDLVLVLDPAARRSWVLLPQ